MKTLLISIGMLLLTLSNSILYAQEQKSKEIDYTSERTAKDEVKYPGALLLYKVNNQVTFTHEGIKVWGDQAIFYKAEQFFRSSGHIKMKQGDTITMTSGYAEYNGNTQFAFASNNVHLITESTHLSTDTLFFDRQKQEAFYRSGGTVKDSASTIVSQIGRYYTEQKKYTFLQDVVVTNANYTIHSNHIDYYTETGEAYLYGPSTIVSDDGNKIYCERGYYNTQQDYGYFIKNSTIYYKDRILKGDSLYFNRKTHFASATNNIKIIDTTNQSVASGHYAEVYRDKDSVFITKRALVAKAQGQKNDSIYIHSDTIMVTGKPEHRLVRAFYNARVFKTDMSGRSDSLILNENTGVTKMLGNPVMFNGLTQLTGDTLELFSDTITNKLDSISVYNHAFLNQKDTLGGFNQVKGKFMYGLFTDNKLTEANFIKNTETIYYWRDGKTGDLIGINKAVASEIQITFLNNEIESISYIESPQNITHKPTDLPKNARKLRGFIWRGDERILTKEQLFEGDPPLDLPKIKGIPLPKVEQFFSPLDERKQPLLNDKSRLDPQQLQPLKSDSPVLPQDSSTVKQDSIILPKNVFKSTDTQ